MTTIETENDITLHLPHAFIEEELFDEICSSIEQDFFSTDDIFIGEDVDAINQFFFSFKTMTMALRKKIIFLIDNNLVDDLEDVIPNIEKVMHEDGHLVYI
jgi:hypothetical protein